MSLQSLPTELLLGVTDHLRYHTVDLQCLRYTCRSYRTCIPTPPPAYVTDYRRLKILQRLLHDKPLKGKMLCWHCVAIVDDKPFSLKYYYDEEEEEEEGKIQERFDVLERREEEEEDEEDEEEEKEEVFYRIVVRKRRGCVKCESRRRWLEVGIDNIVIVNGIGVAKKAGMRVGVDVDDVMRKRQRISEETVVGDISFL